MRNWKYLYANVASDVAFVVYLVGVFNCRGSERKEVKVNLNGNEVFPRLAHGNHIMFALAEYNKNVVHTKYHVNPAVVTVMAGSDDCSQLQNCLCISATYSLISALCIIRLLP